MQKLLSSRRYFLASTGVTASAFLLGSPFVPAQQKSFVPDKSGNPISLDACQNLSAEQVALDSVMVQNARAYLLEQIASIQDEHIKKMIQGVYAQPEVTVVQRLDDAGRKELWQVLTAKEFTKESLESFLPPLPTKKPDGVATFTAPGSGYQSHHAYPGGLATHLAANAFITCGIVDSYEKNYNYKVERDIALGAQLLHDLHKPYVFQWQENLACRNEQVLAGTGEHHILSVAEMIHRQAPAALVIAMVCAHQAPSDDKDEEMVAKWLEAAALIAGVDPVEYGLLERHKGQLRLSGMALQEEFICHLGDHDFVLSVPAVKTTLPVMKKWALTDYELTEADLEQKPFNSLRNRIYAMYSAMRLHQVLVEKGEDGVREVMHSIVLPVSV